MLDLGILNEAQREAVTHGEGPLLVLAGPGSGKTLTITQRIFYLLSVKKVPPERILVITFTREAAKSMQKRFLGNCRGGCPVSFGTFHSFFYHILRESHIINQHRLLTLQDKKKLLLPILKKYRAQEALPGKEEENLREWEETAVKLLAAISYYKNTQDQERAVKGLSSCWKEGFEAVCREYEIARQRSGGLDFDDMLYLCLWHLSRDRELQAYWRKRFFHILIDEFQDINPVQYEIVKLLSGNVCSIFAVGDDDQSIYGFRGSSPACLKRFALEYGAKQLLLDINYRSREEIVKASLLVIGENRERFSKMLRADPARKDPAEEKIVCIYACESTCRQYEAVTGALLEKQNQETLAVLFRTNFRMQRFALYLKKEGIPYEMKEKTQNPYSHFIVRDLTSFMKIAEGTGKREDWLRVWNIVEPWEGRDILEENAESFEKREGRILLEKIRKGKNFPPGLFIRYISKALGYEKHLRKKSADNGEIFEEWLEMLEWAGEDAESCKSMAQWMRRQTEWGEAFLPDKKEPPAFFSEKRERSRISLMTIHASKGLEFDCVCLPDCNENVFPHGRMPDGEDCEEERRIFYVAMTRARKSLELFFVTGTKERPRQPSRFLTPLWKQYYSSTSSSTSQLSRYSSKASATLSYSSSSSIKESSGSSLGSSGFSL